MLNISLSLSLDLPMKEREARVGLVGVEEGGRGKEGGPYVRVKCEKYMKEGKEKERSTIPRKI